MSAIDWLIVFALLVLVGWLYVGFDVPDRLARARAARHLRRNAAPASEPDIAEQVAWEDGYHRPPAAMRPGRHARPHVDEQARRAA